MWVVYDHPTDWPDYFVARLWIGERPTNAALVAGSLERLREQLEEMGLVHLDRMEGDDPVILETWV